MKSAKKGKAYPDTTTVWWIYQRCLSLPPFAFNIVDKAYTIINPVVMKTVFTKIRFNQLFS